MKVALTGSGGFIGKYVAACLDAAGIPYFSLGRGVGPDGAKQGDETDLLFTERIKGVIIREQATHLIHLAWYTDPPLYWESSLNHDWLLATTRLVESFIQAGGKHVLIAGTSAEYDSRSGYFREDITPLLPSTSYGISKHATHLLCRRICNRKNVKLAWARIFLPYGQGENSSRLIPSLFAALSGKRSAFGVNVGSYRDFLHVTDLAQAVTLCTRQSFDGAINISSNRPVGIADIVKEISEILNTDPQLIFDKTPQVVDSVRMIVGDNSLLKSLGWNSLISLREGLRSYKNVS